MNDPQGDNGAKTSSSKGGEEDKRVLKSLNIIYLMIDYKLAFH